MTFDDNPDEVFDENEAGESEAPSGGDEGSNRSFRMMMLGLVAVGAIGALLIGAIFLSKQGDRNQIATQNQAVQQTNTAIAQLSLITPTSPPTALPPATNTATPKPPAPTPTATPVAISMVTAEAASGPVFAPGNKGEIAQKNLVDAAAGAGSFKTLLSLLAASGLDKTLQGKGPFTIFAPTDKAFAQLPPDVLAALKQDPKKLEALLKYHVVEGALKSADMAKLKEQKSLGGEVLKTALVDNVAQINDAQVTEPDVETSNGLIQVIDRLLVPPSLKDSDFAKAVAQITPVSKPATTSGSTAQVTPGAKGTEVAQVPPTTPGGKVTPATGKVTPVTAGNVVPTRVSPGPTAATGVTSTKPISGTTPTGPMPKSGAGDDLLIWLLAAAGLVGVFVMARRLRTAQH